MRRKSLLVASVGLVLGLAACNAVDMVEPQVPQGTITISETCDYPNVEAYGQCLPPRGPKPTNF